MTPEREALREQILGLVSDYHNAAFGPKEFIPGETHVPVSGRVFDASDMQSLVDSSLDFWLTTGRFAAQFEREFSDFCGVNYSLLVNSGSSANLLAVSCLTSHKLGDRALKRGDEVITVAAGFPTTVAPLIQNGLTPVFIDAHIPTYNAHPSLLEDALTDKTKAVIFAHMLGNPFDLKTVTEFTRRHDLWLIEDCCDAVGAEYDGRKVGTFGDLATASFYPAHHITMGEGGCVMTSNPQVKKLAESFRDWGRDCWCEPGRDNTCTRRFDWQLGGLPYGYDHKYIYSHIGYNLKATDMQAAVGVSQLKKLSSFIETRRRNFTYLYNGLKDLQDYLILPEATANSEPSWFGFPITVRDGSSLTRDRVIRYLDSKKIGTRLLFGGNMIRQPAFEHVNYRVVGDLKNSDFIMNQAFWIGVYPGLTQKMLDYVIEVLHEVTKSVR